MQNVHEYPQISTEYLPRFVDVEGTIYAVDRDATVFLRRWRSKRKPIGFIADASVAKIGELIDLVYGVSGRVVA